VPNGSTRVNESTQLIVCKTTRPMPELRVTMTGDREGEFVVEEVRPDGSLVLVSVEVWEAEDEHGQQMQPPDGEA
jgi:hypothetical protein